MTYVGQISAGIRAGCILASVDKGAAAADKGAAAADNSRASGTARACGCGAGLQHRQAADCMCVLYSVNDGDRTCTRFPKMPLYGGGCSNLKPGDNVKWRIMEIRVYVLVTSTRVSWQSQLQVLRRTEEAHQHQPCGLRWKR